MLRRFAGHIRRQPVALVALFVALFVGLAGTAAAASKYLTASDQITQGDLVGSTYGDPAIASGAVTNGKLANPSLAINAGPGLVGGGSITLGGSGSLSVDPIAVQNRVTGSCSSRAAISSIAQDGSVGCAAPAAVVVSALVNPDGTIFTQTESPGAGITVTHTSVGQYALSVTGLGAGCPIPAVTPYFGYFGVTFGGGSCGNGMLNTTVFMADGSDHYWGSRSSGSPLPAPRQPGPSNRFRR